jgi:chaperonin GroEL
LQAAGSIAGLLITAEAVVADLPEDKPAGGGGHHHDMGGMGGMM